VLKILVAEVVVDLFGDGLVGGHFVGINFFYIYKQQFTIISIKPCYN
jgi:hypothetical protein